MELREVLKYHEIDPAEIPRIAEAFEPARFEQHADVYRQGEDADAMYIIGSGRAVASRAEDATHAPARVLGEGEFFGDAELAAGQPRSCTVRAAEALEVYRLGSERFAELRGAGGAFEALIERLRRIALLRGVSLFEHVDEGRLAAIASLLTARQVPAGVTVFDEGQDADALYVIAEGSVRVVKRTRFGREVSVAVLGPGDFFGELGLIEDQPRSAGVVTTADSSLLLLAFDAFRRLLATDAMVSLAMLKVMGRRMRDTTREMTQARGATYFKGINIICRPERCLSCKACEIACAVAKSRSGTLHGAMTETPPPVRRIRVRRRGNGAEAVLRPEHCLHCHDAPCVKSCKLKAIRRDPSMDTVTITSKCVGCGLCVKACPYGVISLIRLESGKRVALKCTFCAEHPSGPACVRACPTNALVLALSSNTTAP